MTERARRKRNAKIRNLLYAAALSLFVLISLVPPFLVGGGDVVELTMVYGSEKRGWIERVAPLFRNWWSLNHANKTLQLRFVALGSRESMNQIVLGEIRPTVWSPASSVWVPLANYVWESEYGTSTPLIESWEPLVLSPMVVATWEGYASSHNFTSLDSVRAWAAQTNSDLRFAHTDPQTSNSGFMALLMEVSAAADVPVQDLTYDDLLRPEVRLWLQDLEGKAVMYGESTGFLADQATSSGPAGLNVFMVYENLVIEKNRQGEPLARWGQKLQAVYPSEGVLMSDHPFCVLDAPWVTVDQREAAKEFLEFLLSRETQALAMSYGFRPVSPEVELEPEVFSLKYGVLYSIPSPTLQAPRDSRVLQSVTDLWLVSRPGG